MQEYGFLLMHRHYLLVEKSLPVVLAGIDSHHDGAPEEPNVGTVTVHSARRNV